MPVLYPGSDDLAKRLGNMSTEQLQQQLASNRLTSTATTIAIEELERRGVSSAFSGDGSDGSGAGDPVKELRAIERSGGRWSVGAWLLILIASFAGISSFGVTSRQPNDQNFLWGVILLQSAFATLALRMVYSFLGARSGLSLIIRSLALGGMLFAIFLLTLCSTLARHGWG